MDVSTTLAVKNNGTKMMTATIQEIEGIDDYWGPAFRSIYESNGHAIFMEQLETRIKQHDKEIERMCNFYYQGFIESIRDLLQVRSHAQALYSEVKELNSNLHTVANGLYVHGDELLQGRQVERNIAAAVEKMTVCLPLMTTYAKLLTQVHSKRYYPALKTLEQLEHVLLPRVSNFRFCADISSSVPKLREAIKDASMADLTDFLENIRKNTPQIGFKAQKHTEEIMGRDLSTIVKNKKKSLNQESQEDDESYCTQDLVDFSPLYRCLHIHSVLGIRNEFIGYYRDQRKQQAQLVLDPDSSMHESIQLYCLYLNSVVGFFIVENHLLNTGGGFVSKEWLDDLWSMAVIKIASSLRKHTSLATDPQLILNIKQQIVLFITTLKYYGLLGGPLLGLLQEMAEQYTEVLMQHWVTLFRDILDNESFFPIEVNNAEEYDNILLIFPFNEEGLEKEPFPRKFPFSSMVPAVYRQVKEFIYACLKFSTGLGLSPSQRAAHVRQSASLLLTRSFTGCLSSLFRRPSLALLQVVQIIIDTQYLEGATTYLHQFIGNITGSETVPDQVQGTMFKVARDDAEQQICDKLKRKLDEFLELENYNWLLGESTGHASSFITDMISFLRNMFDSLTTLPHEVAGQACKAACQHIAVCMHNLVINPGNKQISMGALHQINLDVIQCEHFAACEPVPAVRDSELLCYFAPLRQLLDLVMGWDWPSYLHDVGLEESRYPLVTPSEAAALLEKIKEADHRSSVFSVLKKAERDRKKLLDTVLKQLKQLSQAKEQI